MNQKKRVIRKLKNIKKRLMKILMFKLIVKNKSD